MPRETTEGQGAAFGFSRTYIALHKYQLTKKTATYLPTSYPAASCRNLPTYLKSSTYLLVALLKVRYCVRHFGGVITFPLSAADDSRYCDARQDAPGARSAKKIQGSRRFGSSNPQNFLGDLPTYLSTRGGLAAADLPTYPGRYTCAELHRSGKNQTLFRNVPNTWGQNVYRERSV